MTSHMKFKIFQFLLENGSQLTAQWHATNYKTVPSIV